jgi:hypothetical protein
MKTKILKSTIALLLATVPVMQAQEVKEEPKEEKKEENRAGASATTKASGEVTIELDVNGKKERRTFKLGGDDQPFDLNLKLDDKEVRPGARLGEWIKNKKAKLEKVTWLGIAAEPVGDEVRAQLPLQRGEGLSVRHVAPESPAAKAGIAEHDILTRLDDQILVSADQLRSLVKMRKPGDSVKLTYLRKGEKMDATATLIEHEGEVERDDVFRFLHKHDGKGAVIFGDKNEKFKDIEERLRDLKNKIPGMIVDKKSFLISPDGAVQKLYTEKLEQVVDGVRKQLEKTQTTPEEREQIRKSLEEALRNAREAVEKMEDLVKKGHDRQAEPKNP